MNTWSILVCTKDRVDSFSKCLANLARMPAIGDVDLIVIDSSNDINYELTRGIVDGYINIFHRIVFKVCNMPGIGHARFYGLEYVETNLVCLVDDDNYLPFDYLRKAEQIFRSDSMVGAVGGSSISGPLLSNNRLIRLFGRSFAVGSQYSCENLKLPFGSFLWGAGLCFRNDIWKSIKKSGYVSPRVMGVKIDNIMRAGEDAEIVYLIQIMGYNIYYASDMVFVHDIDVDRVGIFKMANWFYRMGYTSRLTWRYRYHAILMNSDSFTQLHHGGERFIVRILRRISGYGVVDSLFFVIWGLLLFVYFNSGRAVGYFKLDGEISKIDNSIINMSINKAGGES